MQWCDNNQSMEVTQEQPYRPTDMVSADADIVLAIHSIKEKIGFPTACHHVFRHQCARQRKKQLKDEKKKEQMQAKEPCRENNAFRQKQQGRPRTMSEDEEKNDHDTFSPSTGNNTHIRAEPKLTDEANMNIDCDRIASEMTHLGRNNKCSPGW